MMLSEYGSKTLLARHGIPIPEGRIAHTAAEAEEAAGAIAAARCVVKAQISAGGRGLAGGIRFADTPADARAEAAAMLGKPLVTAQTGSGGEVVSSVYVEAAVEAAQQFFIALVIDPMTALPTLLASEKGGVEFEQMARMDPRVVRSLALGEGVGEAEITAHLADAGFPEAAGAAALITKAAAAFTGSDMTLLEVNPLALTNDKAWIALDAKITIDGNALFRQADFEDMAADPGLAPMERIAQENEINLVKLDGNIGVVVNGAGLGLATHDMLIDAGGDPANFMDIRTTATSFDIAKGVGLLLDDPGVRCILLNVHGGGMTVCDTVAEGVAFAYARSKRRVPIVARLAGQNAAWAQRILSERRLPVEVADDMGAAITRAIAVAGGGAA